MIAVVGILWPSIQWADETAIAGGGAGAPDPEAALAAKLLERIEDRPTAVALADLVPRLNDSADARADYLNALRTQIPPPPEEHQDEDPPPQTLLHGDPETVFQLADTQANGLSGTGQIGGGAGAGLNLTDGAAFDPRSASELGSGGAAGFDVGSFISAANNLLNLTTFYTMKNRAGLVGRTGIATAMASIQAGLSENTPAPRLHMAGHSFGARAVTQAAATTTADIHSLTLLQGAFSHYGMATNWDDKGDNGAFNVTPTRLKGPLLVTFTKNDTAVGLAYAIASRLASQTAAGIGGPDDPYGGIGRNGALKTINADPGTLLKVGSQYAFTAAHVANLNSDTFITGHGDVTGPQVAYAILTALSHSEN